MSFFGRKRESPLHAVPQGCPGWGPSHVPLLSTSNPSPPSLSSLHSIISITQPGVNVIFCAGAALAYFLVILLGFDETFFSSVGATVTCNVVLWLGVVAFKLTFGALFAKALRIYYIFYNYRVHNKQKVGVGRDGRTHQSDGPVCYTLPALNIIMCTTPRHRGLAGQTCRHDSHSTICHLHVSPPPRDGARHLHVVGATAYCQPNPVHCRISPTPSSCSLWPACLPWTWSSCWW